MKMNLDTVYDLLENTLCEFDKILDSTTDEKDKAFVRALIKKVSNVQIDILYKALI